METNLYVALKLVFLIQQWVLASIHLRNVAHVFSLLHSLFQHFPGHGRLLRSFLRMVFTESTAASKHVGNCSSREMCRRETFGVLPPRLQNERVGLNSPLGLNFHSMFRVIRGHRKKALSLYTNSIPNSAPDASKVFHNPSSFIFIFWFYLPHPVIPDPLSL